ncbi:MAG: hypothetical protein WKF97_05055 [Chitinophagaceae bacterium]
MNKSPLNYLITVALGVVLWVITAVFYGGTFSESLILNTSTPDQFLSHLRIMLGIAAAIGILNTIYWYYYGSLDSTAAELNKAKKVWMISFILQIIASVAILFVLIALYLTEGVATADWLIAFALMSLHTWFFYWLCTFLMSPRTVQYIPLFK